MVVLEGEGPVVVGRVALVVPVVASCRRVAEDLADFQVPLDQLQPQAVTAS